LNLTANVKVVGEVPPRDLSALYAGALFIAYPSLYEGFGLPVLEAMSYRKAVLTSRTSSLAEIGQGAAVLVDPEDVESITIGLRQLTLDASLREVMIRQGTLRRKQYQWSAIAESVREHLSDVVRR
jgi:glycosyltransferase involved in cell wall biosynthesis